MERCCHEAKMQNFTTILRIMTRMQYFYSLWFGPESYLVFVNVLNLYKICFCPFFVY